MRGIKAQLAACSRKVPYASEVDAAKAGKGLGSYLCPICGRYHLTSRRASLIKPDDLPEPEPVFDGSVVARAKGKPSSRSEVARDELGVCLGKVKADGRVRVRIGEQEFETRPIQPAALRSRVVSGTLVRVSMSGTEVRVIGIEGDENA